MALITLSHWLNVLHLFAFHLFRKTALGGLYGIQLPPCATHQPFLLPSRRYALPHRMPTATYRTLPDPTSCRRPLPLPKRDNSSSLPRLRRNIIDMGLYNTRTVCAPATVENNRPCTAVAGSRAGLLALSASRLSQPSLLAHSSSSGRHLGLRQNVALRHTARSHPQHGPVGAVWHSPAYPPLRCDAIGGDNRRLLT